MTNQTSSFTNDGSSSNSKNVKIKRFDPRTLKPDRSIVLCGATGKGKSVVMKNLLYHLRRKLDFVMAMSPTESSLEFFKETVPDNFIFDKYDDESVADILNLMGDLKHSKKKRNGMLCLDDCMWDKKSVKGPIARKIAMQGRNLNYGRLECVQHIMDYPSELRGNVGYVIATAEPILKNRRKLFENFFGVFSGGFKQFEVFFATCTKNYEVIVLDNTLGSTDINDCIFFYKAKLDLPRFRLCHPFFWWISQFEEFKNQCGDTEHSSSDRIKKRLQNKITTRRKGKSKDDDDLVIEKMN